MVVNGQPTTHAIGPVRIKNLEPYILVPANVAADVVRFERLCYLLINVLLSLIHVKYSTRIFQIL